MIHNEHRYCRIRLVLVLIIIIQNIVCPQNARGSAYSSITENDAARIAKQFAKQQESLFPGYQIRKNAQTSMRISNDEYYQLETKGWLFATRQGALRYQIVVDAYGQITFYIFSFDSPDNILVEYTNILPGTSFLPIDVVLESAYTQIQSIQSPCTASVRIKSIRYTSCDFCSMPVCNISYESTFTSDTPFCDGVVMLDPFTGETHFAFFRECEQYRSWPGVSIATTENTFSQNSGIIYCNYLPHSVPGSLQERTLMWNGAPAGSVPCYQMKGRLYIPYDILMDALGFSIYALPTNSYALQYEMENNEQTISFDIFSKYKSGQLYLMGYIINHTTRDSMKVEDIVSDGRHVYIDSDMIVSIFDQMLNISVSFDSERIECTLFHD